MHATCNFPIAEETSNRCFFAASVGSYKPCGLRVRAVQQRYRGRQFWTGRFRLPLQSARK